MLVICSIVPTGPATLASEFADYAPGSLVRLYGTNWVPGESVHLFINDDSSNTWSLSTNPDPIAAADGTLYFEFTLPSWFVANYSAKATGSVTPGPVYAYFTDLAIGVKVDRSMVRPSWPTPPPDWQVRQIGPGEVDTRETGWIVTRVPAGFVKIAEQASPARA